jgi:hypothetical protein
MALGKIINKQAAPGWALPLKDGRVLAHEALIKTAAVGPLLNDDDGFSFELEGFLAKALELADAEGTC